MDVRGWDCEWYSHAPDTRKLYQLDNLVAADATDVPDSLLKSALYPNAYFVGANIRNLAEAAKNDHLSFFATSEGSRLARMSLPRTAYSPPKPKVTKPTTAPFYEGRNISLRPYSSTTH